MCTVKLPKNNLSLHCGRKTKQLSKKELSNVAPASSGSGGVISTTSYNIYIPIKVGQLRIKISDSHLDGGDLAVLGEHGGELLFGQFLSKVLDEDVREVFRFLAELLLALLAGNELADVDLKKILNIVKAAECYLSIR